MIIVIRCLDVSKYHEPHPLEMSSSPAAIMRERHKMSAVITVLGQCFHMEDAPCKCNRNESTKTVFPVQILVILWRQSMILIKFMRRLPTCMGNR